MLDLEEASKSSLNDCRPLSCLGGAVPEYAVTCPLQTSHHMCRCNCINIPCPDLELHKHRRWPKLPDLALGTSVAQMTKYLGTSLGKVYRHIYTPHPTRTEGYSKYLIHSSH